MDAAASLDELAIVADARAAAGLHDFGDESFRVPLRKLLASLASEASLTPVGRAVQRQRVVDLLVNRLRAEDHFRRHPEILAEEIREPLVIVGLPRTGTTLLHRTIACDPRFHAVLWYECRYPAPIADAGTADAGASGVSAERGDGGRDVTAAPAVGAAVRGDADSRAADPRVARAQAEVRAMLEGSPALAAIHPLDALAPDEEILLLEHSFMSTVPESSANVPSYGRWLDEQDQSDAYRYLKKLLQLLQWQKRRAGRTVPPEGRAAAAPQGRRAVGAAPWQSERVGDRAERWVLKTPHHLGFADLLLRELPDARIVQTHRDPLESIPSLASMICALWALSSEDVDPTVVGRQWNAKMAAALRRCMAVRERHPERFIDVWFRDAVADPIGAVRGIYAAIDLPLTSDAESAMRGFLATNPREGRPPHQYTLAEFGLSDATIARDFAAYRERFILGRR